jgi:SYP7 family syntaxin
VRTDLSALNEDWKELESMHRMEARKKRTKFSPEVMKLRKNMVEQLQLEISSIRDVQRSGYVKGYESQQRFVNMEDSEIFKSPSKSSTKDGKDGKGKSLADDLDARSSQSGTVKARNNNLTNDQKQQLQLIRDRDQKIDDEIVLVGKGVDELHILARHQNEEIKLQNTILDKLSTKMDSVNENVLTVNDRLKKTLEETRKGDKICCDIFCILFLVGMIIVLVKVSDDNKKKK